MLLRIGGWLTILIAIAHVIGLFGAELFFEMRGLGDQLVRDASIHPYLPYYEILFGALMFLWIGLYGLAAGGLLKKDLPLLKIAIFTIAGCFLLRAIGGYIYAFATHVHLYEMVNATLALLIGTLFLLGGLKKWDIRFLRKAVQKPA